MTSNYGNINKYLAAQTYKATLSILEKDASEPRTVGDLMLQEILKRLHAMREIAVRASRLSLSDEERRTCQSEIDKLKEEIESFAALIPPMAEPNPDMQEIDASIARVSDMVAEWEGRSAEHPDATEGASLRESLPEEEKLTRWMDSLMRGWGKEVDRSDTVIGGENGE